MKIKIMMFVLVVGLISLITSKQESIKVALLTPVIYGLLILLKKIITKLLLTVHTHVIHIVIPNEENTDMITRKGVIKFFYKSLYKENRVVCNNFYSTFHINSI